LLWGVVPVVVVMLLDAPLFKGLFSHGIHGKTRKKQKG
jgi:hypothetical protein